MVLVSVLIVVEFDGNIIILGGVVESEVLDVFAGDCWRRDPI